MAKTSWEREAERHREKLARVDEQVSSGELVIRQMTDAEREKWARRRSEAEAGETSAERASRATALENRRRRAARVRPPEPATADEVAVQGADVQGGRSPSE